MVNQFKDLIVGQVQVLTIDFNEARHEVDCFVLSKVEFFDDRTIRKVLVHVEDAKFGNFLAILDNWKSKGAYYFTFHDVRKPVIQKIMPHWKDNHYQHDVKSAKKIWDVINNDDSYFLQYLDNFRSLNDMFAFEE
jgi:DNA-binding protein Fis